jgi:hypothetical protein
MMLRTLMLIGVLFFVFAWAAVAAPGDEAITRYPGIPRIDVHSHPASDRETIDAYLGIRKVLLKKHQCDLALWINLGSGEDPIEDLDGVMKAGQGRLLCCISDFSSHDGLRFPPEELQGWLDRGYVGYKIWAGPAGRRLQPGQKGYPYIDDMALDPTFAKMEEIGMVGASIHIADPCGPWGKRTEWLPDPVEYWRQIIAWRHVLERHPKLKVVNAHGMWAVCQDGQLDYLRNMLATFPGLNVDLAATFQYFPLVNRENLREFMIDYSDRILFGTDIGRTPPAQIERLAERYFNCFRILETDELVRGGFFGDQETKGLKLPLEVLEKIYFKNAMRIYPRVAEALQRLGYAQPQ